MDHMVVVLARLHHGLEVDQVEVGSLSSLKMIRVVVLMEANTLLRTAVASCRTTQPAVQVVVGMKVVAHLEQVFGF